MIKISKKVSNSKCDLIMEIKTKGKDAEKKKGKECCENSKNFI